jgi:hypothetical protein
MTASTVYSVGFLNSRPTCDRAQNALKTQGSEEQRSTDEQQQRVAGQTAVGR